MTSNGVKGLLISPLVVLRVREVTPWFASVGLTRHFTVAPDARPPYKEPLTRWEIRTEQDQNRAAAAKALARAGLDRVRWRNHLSNLVKRYLTAATSNVHAVAQWAFCGRKTKGSTLKRQKIDTEVNLANKPPNKSQCVR